VISSQPDEAINAKQKILFHHFIGDIKMYKFVLAALRLAHVVSSSSGLLRGAPLSLICGCLSWSRPVLPWPFIKNAMQSTLQVNNSRADLSRCSHRTRIHGDGGGGVDVGIQHGGICHTFAVVVLKYFAPWPSAT